MSGKTFFKRSSAALKHFPPRVQKRARVVSTTRTMSAAMPKAQPLDDVSNLIDLDALNKELDQARSNVEMWMARRELSMKEQVAVHKTNMAVAEEEYVSLVEREKDLATAAEELARRQEYQQAELDALQEEAAQAKELGEDLPQQLQTLRAQVTTEKDDLEREQTKITGEEMVKAQMLQAHLSAVDLYRDRLGLRFEIGDAEELRFFYKRVDPADHEREFMVAVRVVDSGGYELMDCDPDMGDQAQALLAECNRTDNLSGFVRGIRKLFRSAVAEEEVAAAAAALREKANIVPPSYVPVEEPVSEPEPVAPRTPFNTKPDDMVPL